MTATIRLLESDLARLRKHLLGRSGEHFAFLRARWSFSCGEPVFLVRDITLVPDEVVSAGKKGFDVDPDFITEVVNAALRDGDALIEAHNHGGASPRFSYTDRSGLREFVPFVLGSLPDRPYAATVWGDDRVYGEYFLIGGGTGVVRSITSVGARLRQLVSRSDDEEDTDEAFARQVLWFGKENQRELGRLRAGIVGGGGIGSEFVTQLAYLGFRDFVLVDNDACDKTNMNRLRTAEAADLGTPKVILGRRAIRRIDQKAKVEICSGLVPDAKVLDRLRGVDVIFGGVDNDGARLVLNELAVSFRIPYFDAAVGISVKDGIVLEAGGRAACVIPGGPCLSCLDLIDTAEARYVLGSPEEQLFQRQRGYVNGMDEPSPSVVSLNATTVGMTLSEFLFFVSGGRSVVPHLELDLLGTGRKFKGQWATPMQVTRQSGCLSCSLEGQGDKAGLERYLRAGKSG